MTSNLISSSEGSPRILGFHSSSDEQQSIDLRLNSKLQSFFKVEFLGRIDELILFRELSEVELAKIADIMLSELASRSLEVGVTLDIDKEVSVFLAKKCMSEHNGQGARPLRREITDSIESHLATRIIDRRITDRCRICISADGKSIDFQSNNK